MVLLRHMIGDALRARRQAQRRTLREVSTAANVSLGYLSEIERGQKEASSELLSAVCDALGTPLSEVLHEVSHFVATEERARGLLTPVPGPSDMPAAEMPPVQRTELRPVRRTDLRPVRQVRALPETTEQPVTGDGVSVTVRRDSPLKTTLLARRHGAKREVVGAT
jgi:transcriptional regulator with XRE-family HTH domain